MPSAAKRPQKPKMEHMPGSGQFPSSPTSASPNTARQPSPAATKTKPSRTSSVDRQTREITVTIPTDKIFSTATGIVMAPVAMARRVLPAKGGIPLYAGLGALAVVGIIEWPVAAAAGAGYALARRWTRQQTKEERQLERTP
jgi:hypothetical protein